MEKRILLSFGRAIEAEAVGLKQGWKSRLSGKASHCNVSTNTTRLVGWLSFRSPSYVCVSAFAKYVTKVRRISAMQSC